jgi:stalled ribosome rescue protein Dom34
MAAMTGVWIDHRRAIIIGIGQTGVEKKEVLSQIDKQRRRLNGRPTHASHKANDVPDDDKRERDYKGHLNAFYDQVIAALGNAESLLVMGPGEAKQEFKKRFEWHRPVARIVGIETTDKMTEPQLISKIRRFFQDAAVQAAAQ